MRLLSAFVLVGFFAVDASAAKPKILLLKDLQPGTKAIGFSVFKGVEPQPFDIVLGEPVEQMGNSFILAKIFGGPMETPLEKIGAISGMSGSPIFVECTGLDDCIKNGTLVGALSYSIGYFIEGGVNCLLTPAEFMLGTRVGGYVAAAQFSNGLPNKISVSGKDFYNLLLFPKIENLPIAVNSAGRCEESLKSDIKPGSMVSVLLATGTINIGASGTVTWRDDDKIYIFGHSLNGTGMVQYPFVQISVADTLQTPLRAYKIPGCHLDTRGAILVDGAFEMAGVIGRTAPMLPYQVELRLGDDGIILSEKFATSPLAQVIIQQLPVIWAQQWLGDVSHFSLAYQMRIAIANQPEIFVKNIIPVRVYENPFREVFNRVYDSLQIMKESGFNYEVESMNVRLDTIKDFGLWTVKKSFLSQEKASPGETVYANVILEEFFGSATKQMSIPIKVPEDFMERVGSEASSNITVLVQGGSKFTDKRGSAGTASVEEFIKQLNQAMNYKTNVLYIQQIMPKSKAEQKADRVNVKALVKPSWKWTDMAEGDLMQLPRDDKNNVTLTLSPALNHFIDLNLSFNLQVQSKKNAASETVKKSKHRKWFLLFLS
ncbi:MAG: hypothetical protein AAB941_01430 [Patescibacteria group bacterium]